MYLLKWVLLDQTEWGPVWTSNLNNAISKSESTDNQIACVRWTLAGCWVWIKADRRWTGTNSLRMQIWRKFVTGCWKNCRMRRNAVFQRYVDRVAFKSIIDALVWLNNKWMMGWLVVWGAAWPEVTSPFHSPTSVSSQCVILVFNRSNCLMQ